MDLGARAALPPPLLLPPPCFLALVDDWLAALAVGCRLVPVLDRVDLAGGAASTS